MQLSLLARIHRLPARQIWGYGWPADMIVWAVCNARQNLRAAWMIVWPWRGFRACSCKKPDPSRAFWSVFPQIWQCWDCYGRRV